MKGPAFDLKRIYSNARTNFTFQLSSESLVKRNRTTTYVSMFVLSGRYSLVRYVVVLEWPY